VSAQYSVANFKPNQLYFGLDYVTSRLGTAFNSNAIEQDNFLASVAWYSRREKQLHFVTKLNAGFFKADLGEDIFDELPSTAVLISPEIGLSYDFKRLPIAFNLGTGYNIGLSPEGESPGTLQPLFYNATLCYQIF
jgi:hypothetical protein